MMFEFAEITVHEGDEQKLVDAVSSLTGLFRDAPGCRSMEMLRTVERPDTFRVIVGWDRIESHRAFTASEAFGTWRALVGPLVAGAKVEHGEVVVAGFGAH